MNQTVLSLTLSAIMLLSALSGLMIVTPSVEAEDFCKEAITFQKAPGANPEETGVFQPVQVSWHADPGYDTGFVSKEGAGNYTPTNDITFEGNDDDRDPVWNSTLTQIADKNTLLFNYDRYSPGAQVQNIQDIYATRNDAIAFQAMNYYTTPQSVKVQFVIKPREGVIHTSPVVVVPACSESAEEPGTAEISIPVAVPTTPFQFKHGDKKLVAELVAGDGAFLDKITLKVDVKKSVRTKEKPFKVLIKPIVFKKDYDLNEDELKRGAKIAPYYTQDWLEERPHPEDMDPLDEFNLLKNSDKLPKAFEAHKKTGRSALIESLIQDTFPIAQDAVHVKYERTPIFLGEVSTSEPGPGGMVDPDAEVFEDCEQVSKSEDGLLMLQMLLTKIVNKNIPAAYAKEWDRIVIMIPPCLAPPGSLGFADGIGAGAGANKKIVFVSWKVAIGDGPRTKQSVLHELGHTFKLEHGYGNDASVVPPNKDLVFRTLQAFGYKVNHHKQNDIPKGEVDGPGTKGFMGVADEIGPSVTWITKENYQTLLAKFTDERLDPTVLTLMGILNRTDTFRPSVSWWIHEGVPDAAFDEPGDFSVRTLDGTGNILHRTNFTCDFTFYNDFVGVTETDLALVFMTILMPSGTSSVQIVNQTSGAVIFQRNVSANPPIVQLTKTLKGETLAKGAIVHWNGSDPDGDELHYTLELSWDEGENWTTIVANLKNTSYQMDILAGLDDGTFVLKIVANDGFHWTEDISEPFTLLANSSNIYIESEPAGVQFNINGSVSTTPISIRCDDLTNLTLNPAQTHDTAGKRYVWHSWTDGGGRDRVVNCSNTATYHAIYALSTYEVTVDSEPLGMPVKVGGVWHTTPITLWLDPGSQHTIMTNASQSGMLFESWSDKGARTHFLTINGPMNVTAQFSSSAPLEISITAEPSSGTTTVGVAFSSTVGGGIEPYGYVWDFGDGSIGSGGSVSHQYTAVGGYTVTLVATDALGSTAQDTILITVSEANATGPDEKKAKDDESFIPGPGMMSSLCALVLATLLYRRRNS